MAKETNLVSLPLNKDLTNSTDIKARCKHKQELNKSIWQEETCWADQKLAVNQEQQSPGMMNQKKYEKSKSIGSNESISWHSKDHIGLREWWPVSISSMVLSKDLFFSLGLLSVTSFAVKHEEDKMCLSLSLVQDSSESPKNFQFWWAQSWGNPSKVFWLFSVQTCPGLWLQSVISCLVQHLPAYVSIQILSP